MSGNNTQTTPRVGVVLSSGGVRGVFAHTGFILALQQLGIPITAAAGCSAGAVVGGILASGQSMQSWADALLSIRPNQFWTPSWLRFFWSFLIQKGRGYTGMSPTRPAMDYCVEHLKVQTFEECVIPFYSLAINVATGEKTIFNAGELAPRMLASAAVPLLYQPVEIDGEFYCDGALLDLAPTDAICCKQQLDVLIIHHVAERSEGQQGLRRAMEQPWSVIEILNRLLYQRRPWYLSDDQLSFKQCPCGCNAVIITIEPNLPRLEWPVTTSGSQVFQSAMDQTSNLLAPYKKALIKNAGELMTEIDESSITSVLSNDQGRKCGSK